ncbi:hypothetical protein [Methylosinus sp. Sm6]|uniref:hypothetical protein n=1 Tax=Methylosinus sp. Sm6 TaxID=2866948 RepID=UPI001C9968D2|nr:hypothetical protein [Methylosinus sp. Sm6]MBY6242204.1 hypothetical protein [Methylosinus sp. Sm6]
MRQDDPVRSWTSRAGIVRVRNALNPLLWSISLGTPMCWVAAYFFRDDTILKYGFSALGALPILGTLAAYAVFLFRDPTRLQSEEYQLRHQALQILHKQGDNSDIVDVAVERLSLRIEERSPEEP